MCDPEQTLPSSKTCFAITDVQLPSWFLAPTDGLLPATSSLPSAFPQDYPPNEYKYLDLRIFSDLFSSLRGQYLAPQVIIPSFWTNFLHAPYPYTRYELLRQLHDLYDPHDLYDLYDFYNFYDFTTDYDIVFLLSPSPPVYP
ncbi:hypothetical protein OF83DRAFT_1179001 [Amylostereum chailletii]|nr:hypothetical protein OF83DRAFT_1179001 [Amylostereum chailletii]